MNAVDGLRGSAFALRTPGYGPVLDGLGDFDRLNAAVRARQDGITRSAVTASAHVEPAHGQTATLGSSLASAVSAYAASASGRDAIEKAASGACDWLKRFFAAGAHEQLPLPFEV